MFSHAPRCWSRLRVIAALALLLTSTILSLPSGATLAAPPTQTNDKLVLAFYFPWYGQAVFRDQGNQMSDQPIAAYDSNDPAVIDRQIGEAQEAGIDAFISAWQGTGSVTDQNLPKILDAAAAKNFKVSIYFETNFAKQAGNGDIAGQLRTALSNYMNHPAFLHWHGKPVIFFWDPGSLGDATAWRNLRQQIDPANSQIWSVDTTDPSYLDVFDTIHLFSAGKWAANTDMAQVDAQWRTIVNNYNHAHGTTRMWTAGVIPGWDESRVQPPRQNPKVFPRTNGDLYRTAWRGATASNPEWITITSYNEWFEGTQIEPSAAYGPLYLTLTQQFTSQWKGATPANTATPAPASTATPSPRPPTPGGQPDVCAGGTAFPQTGHSICKPMESYWQQYGGLAQFGYPIGDPLVETSQTDGKQYTVQYFERARFELHPENADPRYAVLLGLLGTQFHRPDPAAAPITDGQHQFFAQTGHNVSSLFYAYWQQHGGLFVNGYPISEERQEVLSDGKTYTVQYFERARYEAHPENAPPYNVLLGFLGRQAWTARGGH